MQELTKTAANPTEFLKDETRLCFADNFNEYLSIKHQDGKAGEMRNFCVVYMVQMNPVPVFVETMYPIEEGQPKITFLDQKIPAPVFMLPYEMIDTNQTTMYRRTSW